MQATEAHRLLTDAIDALVDGIPNPSLPIIMETHPDPDEPPAVGAPFSHATSMRAAYRAAQAHEAEKLEVEDARCTLYHVWLRKAQATRHGLWLVQSALHMNDAAAALHPEALVKGRETLTELRCERGLEAFLDGRTCGDAARSLKDAYSLALDRLEDALDACARAAVEGGGV